MLDRLEAFTGGQLDTGGSHVVLQVDELLGRAGGGLVVGHLEQRHGRFFLALLGLRQGAFDHLEAGFGSGLGARFETVGQGVAQAEHAIHGTGAVTLLEALAGHEGEDVFTPDRPAAQVGRQVYHRAVAAGADNQVALHHFAGAGDLMALQVDGADARASDALAATGLDHGAACEDAHATGAGFFHPGATRVAAGVGHGHHLLAGVEPVQHHAVGVVVVGGQHQLATRRHAVAVHIGGDGAGEHVARHVVVRIHQRTLVGAGGQHHALGTDAMHAVTGLAMGRDFAQMVGQALVDGEEVVIVIAVHRGARQQGHFRQFFQLGDDLGHPLGSGLAVQGLAGIQQAAAELFLLVGEDHAGAATAGGQGSGETGRAGADHQYVAVLVHVVVDVRVDFLGRTAEAGSLANVLLVGQPQVLRIHEGLVVEPGRHHAAADLAEDTHDVVFHVRPAVGAAGHQARVQRLLGGTHVGHLGGFGGTDLQHGVGLFRTGGDDAARTGVLEAAADDVDAVGQQGRGQGVAGKALIVLAVEGEGQRLAAIDAATLGKTVDLAHAVTPAVAAFFSPTLASVTVGFSPIL
ncbi:hypothetical protein D9M72_316270 [compost metagenome]